MADEQKSDGQVTREQLIELLNEDLAREYQAIIAYVVYSQVMKGAEYMTIAKELETHASEELEHALIVSKLIDYLGGEPTVTAKPVKTSEKAEDMLRFDLDNENETVRNYRERVKQCEALGEYAMAEHLRDILKQEQEHQIDLATALGEDVPDVSKMKPDTQGARGKGQGTARRTFTENVCRAFPARARSISATATPETAIATVIAAGSVHPRIDQMADRHTT